MFRTKEDVFDFIYENDVKFVRLMFCDIFGALKNISISPAQLDLAFEHGISFDASSIKGFLQVDKSDLLLFPDPSTLSVLPWRPQQSGVVRLMCDIRYADGTPFEGDCRTILRRQAEKAHAQGLYLNFGPECEFYLFETDTQGRPTFTPHDEAGYFDFAPLDKGENVRREICLLLEEMGLSVESSHHESGPGQHEIDFKYSGAVQAADNLTTFKAVVKTAASHNGLYASFMPKPLNNQPGSGLHINLSIEKDGRNLFAGGLDTLAEQFMAGIFKHIAGLSLFLNPTVNSYKRLGKGFEAPRYITWSRENRSHLIRIPAAQGNYSRMELRSPDGSCNPYLCFALLIEAGLEGIRQGLTLPESAGLDAEVDVSALKTLPASLYEALVAAKSDPLIPAAIGQHCYDKFLSAKQAEWDDYTTVVDSWERGRYFGQL